MQDPQGAAFRETNVAPNVPGVTPYPPPSIAHPSGPIASQWPATTPRRRRRWPWVVGACLVVLVVGAVIAGMLFGRKGSQTPHDAAQKFWTALVHHDTKTAQKYVCAKKDLTGAASFKQAVNDLTWFSIGPESGSGNERTYPVTLHLSANSQTEDGVLQTTVTKDAGQWFVCDLGNFVPSN